MSQGSSRAVPSPLQTTGCATEREAGGGSHIGKTAAHLAPGRWRHRTRRRPRQDKLTLARRSAAADGSAGRQYRLPDDSRVPAATVHQVADWGGGVLPHNYLRDKSGCHVTMSICQRLKPSTLKPLT